MEHKKDGITVAGSLIVDASYQVDTYPQQGMLTRIRSVKYNVGGNGNIILDLAKIDKELLVKASGIVGQDDAGQMIIDVLSEYPNIDIRNLTQEGITSLTHVMNACDTKQRTFFFMPQSSDVYDESYIDWDIVDARIFHLEYLLCMAQVDAPNKEYGTNGAKILHDAQQRGMKTSIDIISEEDSRAKQIVTPALKYTNYCIINEVEAGDIVGFSVSPQDKIDDSLIKEAMNIIRELGVSDWVVVHSKEAGYGLDCRNNKLVRVPSLNLPEGFVKGTTGAGDAYCSGVLYGAYMDWNIKEALHFAAATAACSLSQENGSDGLRSRDEIIELEKNML